MKVNIRGSEVKFKTLQLSVSLIVLNKNFEDGELRTQAKGFKRRLDFQSRG